MLRIVLIFRSFFGRIEDTRGITYIRYFLTVKIVKSISTSFSSKLANLEVIYLILEALFYKVEQRIYDRFLWQLYTHLLGQGPLKSEASEVLSLAELTRVKTITYYWGKKKSKSTSSWNSEQLTGPWAASCHIELLTMNLSEIGNL